MEEKATFAISHAYETSVSIIGFLVFREGILLKSLYPCEIYNRKLSDRYFKVFKFKYETGIKFNEDIRFSSVNIRDCCFILSKVRTT